MDKKFEITGTTELTCLLGNPVSHSISPAMHNASFQKLGLDYTYLAFSVDETHFERAVDGLITLGAAGWNCTMPLKRLMYERVDTLSDSALLSGAVNTVVNRDGQLFGDNTDGYGFLQSMRDAGFSCEGKHAVLLGSGGAAAAILAQAALDGAAAIDVFARSASASTRLIAEEIQRIHARCDCRIRLFDLADSTSLRHCLDEADVLINASSVGMAPNTDASLIPDPAFWWWATSSTTPGKPCSCAPQRKQAATPSTVCTCCSIRALRLLNVGPAGRCLWNISGSSISGRCILCPEFRSDIL